MSRGRTELIDQCVESYRLTTHWLFQLVRDAVSVDAGLHPGMFFLMKVLREKGPLSQADLATVLHHSDAAVSKQISVLRERGYVTTGQPAGNRRKVMVSLSEYGREELSRARQRINRRLAAAMKSVPDDTLITLNSLNEQLRNQGGNGKTT